MFKQSTDKFATMVQAMKQMATEMHDELEATRNELRRGVLEMPQEAADNTAQMRKVIVDQIEALAELNRIVAHHGRGLDVVTAGRPSPQRQEEPLMAASPVSRNEVRMRDTEVRMRDVNSASTLPPPDLGAGRSRAAPKPRRFRRPAAARMDGCPTCSTAPTPAPVSLPAVARRSRHPIRWSRCRSTSAG